MSKPDIQGRERGLWLVMSGRKPIVAFPTERQADDFIDMSELRELEVRKISFNDFDAITFQDSLRIGNVPTRFALPNLGVGIGAGGGGGAVEGGGAIAGLEPDFDKLIADILKRKSVDGKEWSNEYQKWITAAKGGK